MQAINDMEMDTKGLWRNLLLLPWGFVYRVIDPHSISKSNDILLLQRLSHKISQSIQIKFHYHIMNFNFYRMFPPGSWEFAMASLYYDSFYQLGLFLLTYSIDILNHMNDMSYVQSRLGSLGIQLNNHKEYKEINPTIAVYVLIFDRLNIVRELLQYVMSYANQHQSICQYSDNMQQWRVIAKVCGYEFKKIESLQYVINSG
jgi:hypothetical protein